MFPLGDIFLQKKTLFSSNVSWCMVLKDISEEIYVQRNTTLGVEFLEYIQTMLI